MMSPPGPVPLAMGGGVLTDVVGSTFIKRIIKEAALASFLNDIRLSCSFWSKFEQRESIARKSGGGAECKSLVVSSRSVRVI
jgi:hypothetical protein